MKATDLMRRPVECVNPEQVVTVAAQKMRDSNVGFLVVCQSDGQMVGVLTDRDIAVRVCAEELSPTATPISETMSRDVIHCEEHDELSLVQERMAKYKKSRIVIVDANARPVGVISLSDLAAEFDPRVTELLGDIAEREVLNEERHIAPR